MIYFIQAGEAGAIKIGLAADPSGRLMQLQTSSASPLRMLRTFDGGRELEAALHRRFARLRLHGEWFKPDEELLRFAADPRPPMPSLPPRRHLQAVDLPSDFHSRVKDQAERFGLGVTSYIRLAITERVERDEGRGAK